MICITGACELTPSSALTSIRGSARRRGTTDAWSFLAAQCRGVQPYYKYRGADDEGRSANRFNKEAERVREHRRRRGVIVGYSETPSSRHIKQTRWRRFRLEKHNFILDDRGICKGHNSKSESEWLTSKNAMETQLGHARHLEQSPPHHKGHTRR